MAKKDGDVIEMSQETARNLYEQGAMLVFLDVPKGTEFGIDYNAWTVDTNFKGVKMIPPGIHFIYYSAVSKQKEVAPRTGFFYNFTQKQVLIKKWSPSIEDIDPTPVSTEEQERVELNKHELDRFLGAYPYDSYKKWISLTNHITEDILAKLQPQNSKICSVTELRSEPSTTQSRKQAAEERMRTDTQPEMDPDDPRLPKMQCAPESAIQFTKIPKKKYPEGASPADMTKYSMDHSYVLECLINSRYPDNEQGILGEIQFAFLCFLLGQVFDAFEQWKHLVHLLCSCEESIAKHPVLYTQFISILHYHIREIPEDFFVDIVTRNNFLVSTLRNFFANLAESGCKAQLKTRGQKFKTNLEKRFNWDFSLDDEDDDPVVVDLA